MCHVVEAGYSKPLSKVSLCDQGEIVSTLLAFHLFLKVKGVMDQFREGLQVAGLLHFMTKYTDLLRPLFVDEKHLLTARKRFDIVLDMH